MTRRNTIQRSLVLNAVNQLRAHVTAEEVYQLVSKEHPNVSRATVYRNLRQLAEDGEIRAVEVPGGAERFDHLCTPHYHVKCTRCGRLFDVEMDYIPDLAGWVKNARGFQITGHDIIFRGVCPDCTSKEQAEP